MHFDIAEFHGNVHVGGGVQQVNGALCIGLTKLIDCALQSQFTTGTGLVRQAIHHALQAVNTRTKRNEQRLIGKVHFTVGNAEAVNIDCECRGSVVGRFCGFFLVHQNSADVG